MTMRRSRGTWEHKKGGLGVQALIFIDFGWMLGPHFDSFSEMFDIFLCFFSMLVSRSLLLTILGSESGRLGLQKQGFGMRSVAKTNFSQKSEFS